jgi:hypothetical protein
MEWIYDDIYMPAKEGKKKIGIVEATMQDNPTLSKDAIERFMAELSPEERQIRTQGQYVHLGGSVFPDFSPSTHCLEKGSFTPTAQHRIIRTMDSGYTNPTVWLWLAVDEDNNVTVFKEHYAAKKTVEEHAVIVNQITKDMERDFKVKVWLTTGDPAIKQTKEHTGTSILQEYQRHGIFIAVDMIPKDRRIGLERIRQYMKWNKKSGRPHLMITDDCPNLIAELPKLRWKKWASPKIAEQNNKHEDIRDRDNHCYDALKYAMTFLADLAPDNVEETLSTRQFHDTFKEAFQPVHSFSEYDDSDDWGPSWNGSTTMRQLEGN